MPDNISSPILVDTSVWIDYFKGKNKPVLEKMDQFLEQDSIVSVELIHAELLRGALSDKEMKFLEDYFSQIPLLAYIPTWKEVGLFSYQMARKGYLPHLVDAHIAFSAIINKVPLFSKDKDFAMVAARSELRLYTS